MAGNFHFQLLFLCIFRSLLVYQAVGFVVELDDSFRELRKSGYWFVEFYAPWCGHCKHLQPIWNEVGETLTEKSSVITAKLDCTKYRELAEEMDIHGFPTLKFFRGKMSTTFHGPRTKKALVQFALKASRPILSEFNTTSEFEQRRKKTDVFFLFVRDKSQSSEDYQEIVKEVAENKIAHAVFYTIINTHLPKEIKLKKVPSVLVFKDSSYSIFEEEEESLNQTSLAAWVDREKFLSFLIASDSNVDELADTGKMIVFATFAKEEGKTQQNKRLGEILKKLSAEVNSKFVKHFQFAVLFQNEIVESIMMSTAELPFILVLEPRSRVYYMLPASAISESFGTEQLAAFLEDILNGKATAYGGRTFSQRMWRIWWEVRSSAKDIWDSSRVMAVVIFGLPILVFTALVVMLCCMDTIPDEEENDEQVDQMGERGEESNTSVPASKPEHLKAE